MGIDEKWMRFALEEARIACEEGEIPVGAVVVKDGEMIAAGHNLREKSHSPSGHAEIIAIERAAEKTDSWKLDGCTLYVTLEPCVMCAGACIQSRLDRVVFGAYDREAGCMGSVADLTILPLGKRPDVFGGVLEEECREMLQTFFENIRH
ncbi:MAG: tRNA adenosine(34) deaminase TadA [Oscillospiraceae bacterium]|nr:tRNA adenosine(34) deaminase TadA [Oscillospiraceae bacterium]